MRRHPMMLEMDALGRVCRAVEEHWRAGRNRFPRDRRVVGKWLARFLGMLCGGGSWKA